MNDVSKTTHSILDLKCILYARILNSHAYSFIGEIAVGNPKDCRDKEGTSCCSTYLHAINKIAC